MNATTTKASLSLCRSHMRSAGMRPVIPVLEVAADELLWSWDMWAAVNGDNTLVAGFSHVSVRTARLYMDCHSDPHHDDDDDEGPSAEEALVGIVRHAPPAMRTCSVGFASLPDDTEPTWDLELKATYGARDDSDSDDYEYHNHYDHCQCRSRSSRDKSFYHSASKLASRLQSLASEAYIKLRVDRAKQEVHFTR